MTTTADRLAQLGQSSLREAARLVDRKGVYRKVEVGRFQVAARDSVAPQESLDLRIEFWRRDRFGSAALRNPYLSEDDIERFAAQDAICVVVLDGARTAASSCKTNGRVYIHELQRTISVPKVENYSCRTYLAPEYLGRALQQHMHHYSAEQCLPDDVVWGLVYRDNVASIRSLERLGWRQTGEYWSRYVLGKQFSGERHVAPLRATTMPPTP